MSAGRYTDYLLIAWVLALAFTGYLLLRHRAGRKIAFISLSMPRLYCQGHAERFCGLRESR
jgi:hypothetical protein